MLNGQATRREFLLRASLLSLAIPGAGAALSGCGKQSESQAAAAPSGSPAVPVDGKKSNGASKGEMEHAVAGESGSAAGETVDVASVEMKRFDPKLPPLPKGNVQNLHWHSQETFVRISDQVVVAGWTFEENIPAPIIHCKVGDTINFTLTNDVAIPHSMDFHAAQIDPKTAFRSVAKGESVSYSFKPRRAGAFLYHCGTPPVLMHIGTGMFGAIIVSPADPLPPAKEFVLVQNEFYLKEPVGADGVSQFDYPRMLSGTPQIIAFNGRPNQYQQEPMQVDLGDRVRFWVVNAGPTLPCAFHLIGEQFETVYLGTPPGSAIHGVQTFSVPAGGGMVFELVCDIPGEFTVVNHAMGHGQKGAMGRLVVKER